MQSDELLSAQPVQQASPAVPISLKSRIQWAFWGQDGLRAFWRLLIFMAIVMSLRTGVGRVLHLLHVHLGGAETFTARSVLIRDGLAFLVVLAASAVMGAFEKRSLADYGLPLRGVLGIRFLEGLLWGFVAECATMFTLYFTGNVTFHGFDQQGTAALYYAAMWAAAFLMVGFFEEFLFRGYPQFTLARGMGFWPAALVLSGLFWLAHMQNSGETWVGGLSAALGAIAFCVSLWFTGNLWFAIGLHASWDWAETYFFGVPDSGNPAIGHLLNTTLSGSKWMTGGTTGPEGSVIELLVVGALIGLLFVRFRRSSERSAVALSG
jgi:membrane protease YdiL (CAAX protease family)